MTIPYITELALRTAVNSIPRTVSTDDSGIQNQIKDIATKKASELITANGTSSGIASQITAQETAIGIAIVGIGVAYKAISSQMCATKKKRLNFDKERQAGFASFILPYDIEETSYSKEETVVKNFIALSRKSSRIFHYLGIHEGDLRDEQSFYFTVLPFFKMSDALVQPLASMKLIDKHRNAISLFFKSALPEAITEINDDFQSDTRVGSFFSSSYQGNNYLNNLRGPRLIIMAMANLLWNIQHPIDPVTGFPLNLYECMKLCKEVELFLNQILDHTMPPYLHEIGKMKNLVLSFIRKIEIHTKTLHEGYIDSYINELNIDDVTNGAHRALRVMDKSILKLIYKTKSPITGKNEPTENAAEDIAYQVSYLNQILNKSPFLCLTFDDFRSYLPEEALRFLNPTSYTVIDILVIYCHLYREPRVKLLEAIEKSDLDSSREMVKTLRNIKDKFFNAIRDVEQEALEVSVLNRKRPLVARRTASKFIPLMTLVLEDYRVDADRIDPPIASDTGVPYFNGRVQIQRINEHAEDGGGYFQWHLSPYFPSLEASTADSINSLPYRQYKMTKVTKLLDSLEDIIVNYRNFLQDIAFQAFLTSCLKKIKEGYQETAREIDSLDLLLAKDEKISRSLTGILRPMLEDLDKSVDAFTVSAESITQKVESEHFTEQQKRILEDKLRYLHDQCLLLFGRVETPFFENQGIAPGVVEGMDHIECANGAFTEYPPSFRRQVSSEHAFFMEMEASVSARTSPSPSVAGEDNEEHLDADEEADNASHQGISLRHSQSRLAMLNDASNTYAPASSVCSITLRKMIVKCYESMSLMSKLGSKGRLIYDLLNKIDNSNLTNDELYEVFYDLVRYSASYRQTWFLQASYAQTRTAKALIDLIKNPDFQRKFPIATLLYGSETVNLSRLSDHQLVAKMINLKNEHHWEDDTSQFVIN